MSERVHSSVCYEMSDFYDRLTSKIQWDSVEGGNGECRIWQGALSSNGKYGVISFKCPLTNKWKKKNVHRVSYMSSEINMDIDSSLDASHLCHNSLCV